MEPALGEPMVVVVAPAGPTPDARSNEIDHPTPGLWRFVCCGIVLEVAWRVLEGAFVDGEYGKPSRGSNPNCSNKAASPPAALKSYVILRESRGERNQKEKVCGGGIGAGSIVMYEDVARHRSFSGIST